MKNWQRLKQNPDLKKHFLIREKVVDGIRAFFKQAGFHEVETPLLVQHPGTEPYLEVFETQLKVAERENKQGFLLTSPELSLKKLLAAGFGNIFEISKSFRNHEGLSDFHNPEFTILEWYRNEADYKDIMSDCEQLLLYLHQVVNGGAAETQLEYQGKSYDLSVPWERISVAEAFKKYADVAEETLLSAEKLQKTARHKGYNTTENNSWEEAYNQIFLNEVEPHLGKNAPTILYDYPASQAALARKKQSDPRYAERFEVYLAGLELGNAFSELTDHEEQKVRMLSDLRERKQLGKTEYGLDEDFIEALKDMPETGGIAVGVDRLTMLFADAPSIKDVLLFPAEDIFDLNEPE